MSEKTQREPALTGNERWLVAGQQGADIFICDSSRLDFWWPITFVEMDTGLIHIDVCGKKETWHLDQGWALRINGDGIILFENFYDQPELEESR